MRYRPTREESQRGQRGGAAARARLKEVGMTAARKWREDHHPSPAEGHMPFAGHRTCAENGEAESLSARPSNPTEARWCAECKQLRPWPCRYALCPLQAQA